MLQSIVVDKEVRVHYPFLSRLPTRLRYELCVALKPLRARRGELVYTEGEYGDEMYLVKKGACQSYKSKTNTVGAEENNNAESQSHVQQRLEWIYGKNQGGCVAEGVTLHVRGIGGPTAEPGPFESVEKLSQIFR
jgi:CRP-like cAMP-binding protein